MMRVIFAGRGVASMITTGAGGGGGSWHDPLACKTSPVMQLVHTPVVGLNP